MDIMDAIGNWTVLRQLSEPFVSSIRIVCVFGENEVIFVTADDNVYAFGDNSNGCLGLGHNNAVEEPTRVDTLCNKYVTKFAYGDSHVLALTRNGVIYSCGYNEVGQLGNGTILNSNQHKLIAALIGQPIAEVAAGKYHSIALTHSGEVFAWGYNNCGQIGNSLSMDDNQLLPIRLSGFSRTDRVIGISCGGYHTLALTENGCVYSWGRNDFGQLGIGNNIKQNTPTKINTNIGALAITRICCGQYHNLLLTDAGDVYAFGLQYPNDHISEDVEFDDIDENDMKSLMGVNVAKKVVTHSPTIFTDIAACNQSNISVALSQNGYCHIWGESVEEVLTAPKETPIRRPHDIFAIYSLQKITYAPIFVADDPKRRANRVADTIANLFNDPQYSDLKFKFDDNYIYCHKLILKSRCEHFRAMLSANWSESETEIELSQYSYAVYYAFLEYVYTDCVHIAAERAMDLYDLANSYLEDDLKLKCATLIKNEISVDTFCRMYSDSIKYNLKEFEEFCFDFALNNLNSICVSDAFLQMDANLCKRLAIKAANIRAFK